MIFLAAQLALALAMSFSAHTPVEVFKSGEDGYKSYRIPAMIQAPNGDPLAFCEGRRGGRSDTGDIDILLKRSTDGGASWSKSAVVWDDGANTCGNPCPVVDRRTGKILLLLTHNPGQDPEHKIIAGTSTGTRTVWVCESADNGQQWTAPIEVTSTTKEANWTWYATGPGAGIQLERGEHAGRLVIPCDHIEAETKHYYSHVIFSDDGGKSWELGGSTPMHQVNECEVAELEDGRLLLNMRNYDSSKHQRQIATSSDGGKTWTDQRHDAALIEPRCQASLRRLRWAVGERPGVLLFSNPADPKARKRMTLRASYDDGSTWTRERVLYEGSSAYSCLVALDGGDVGCFFEVDSYGRMVFMRIAKDNF